MSTPARRLSHIIQVGVNRFLSRLTPPPRNIHQVAEPRNTPSTRSAAAAKPPADGPSWKLAKITVKDRIVAGFVSVKPKVVRYAASQPRAAPTCAASADGREKKVRTPR